MRWKNDEKKNSRFCFQDHDIQRHSILSSMIMFFPSAISKIQNVQYVHDVLKQVVFDNNCGSIIKPKIREDSIKVH